MKGKDAEDLSWGRILEMGNGCFQARGTGNDVKGCEREPTKDRQERGTGLWRVAGTGLVWASRVDKISVSGWARKTAKWSLELG